MTLKPGRGREPLICVLDEFDLNDPPMYYALSYCWSKFLSGVPLECDSRQLQLTLNLSQALLRVRDTLHPITLWVDAICINQSDTREKSQQVRLMKDIYSKAFEVLIWLGPEDENSPMVMELLEAHRKKLEDPYFHVREAFDADAPEWKAIKEWLLRPWFWRVWTIQESRLAKSATLFFGKYQVDLATVNMLMTINVVSDNQGMAGHLQEAFTKPGLSVRLSAWRDRISGSQSLFGLLASSRRHQASDPRDKVYGLLGLTQEFDAGSDGCALLVPDYGKSVMEVYRNAARFLITRHKSLEVLRAVFIEDSPQGSVHPYSWVPRWNSEIGPIFLGERAVCHRYYASGWDPATTHYVDGTGLCLTVSGVEVGAVDLTAEPFDASDIWLETQSADSSLVFERVWQQIRSHYGSAQYDSEKDLISVFTDTLFAGLNGRGENNDLCNEVCCFAAYLSKYWKKRANKFDESNTSTARVPLKEPTPTQFHVSESSITFMDPNLSVEKDSQYPQPPKSSLRSYFSPDATSELMADGESYSRGPGSDFEQYARGDFVSWQDWEDHFALEFQAVCTDVCHLRRHFITKDGLLGIGPKAMRKTDVVCVLLGANTPFVLRKIDKSDDPAGLKGLGVEGNLYQCIGECYIGELMHGEAIAALGDGPDYATCHLV